MELLHLPPVPKTIRHLTTEESRQINLMYPNSRGKCITCRGTKRFLWYPDGTRAMESVATYECPCNDQFLLHRRFLHSGIFEKYQRLGWDDFAYIPEEALTLTDDYLEHADAYVTSGMGVILWGNRGSGKSMMMMLMAKALVSKGIDCYSNTFSGILELFTDGWRGADERKWFNRRIRNAKVLLIDDLGRERNRGTGSVGENTLEEVLRHRVARAMPTIITTNINPETVRSGYGDHTMSLLSEQATFVHFPGLDRRAEMNERTVNEHRAGLTRPVVIG